MQMAGAKIADRLAMRPIQIELNIPGAGPATGTLPIPLVSLVQPPLLFSPLLSSFFFPPTFQLIAISQAGAVCRCR